MKDISLNQQKSIEYEKLHKRAKQCAMSKGYGEIAEDFAQSLIQRYCEGKSQHQTIDQSFIDYLREQYGRTRTNGSHNRYEERRNAVDITTCRDLAISATELRFNRDYSFLFRGRELEIYQDYFILEETEDKIGSHYDVTESRICQILSKIKNKLATQIIYEKMENEELKPIEIEWIEF